MNVNSSKVSDSATAETSSSNQMQNRRSSFFRGQSSSNCNSRDKKNRANDGHDQSSSSASGDPKVIQEIANMYGSNHRNNPNNYYSYEESSNNNKSSNVLSFPKRILMRRGSYTPSTSTSINNGAEPNLPSNSSHSSTPRRSFFQRRSSFTSSTSTSPSSSTSSSSSNYNEYNNKNNLDRMTVIATNTRAAVASSSLDITTSLQTQQQPIRRSLFRRDSMGRRSFPTVSANVGTSHVVGGTENAMENDVSQPQEEETMLEALNRSNGNMTAVSPGEKSLDTAVSTALTSGGTSLSSQHLSQPQHINEQQRETPVQTQQRPAFRRGSFGPQIDSKPPRPVRRRLSIGKDEIVGPEGYYDDSNGDDFSENPGSMHSALSNSPIPSRAAINSAASGISDSYDYQPSDIFLRGRGSLHQQPRSSSMMNINQNRSKPTRRGSTGNIPPGGAPSPTGAPNHQQPYDTYEDHIPPTKRKSRLFRKENFVNPFRRSSSTGSGGNTKGTLPNHQTGCSSTTAGGAGIEEPTTPKSVSLKQSQQPMHFQHRRRNSNGDIPQRRMSGDIPHRRMSNGDLPRHYFQSPDSPSNLPSRYQQRQPEDYEKQYFRKSSNSLLSQHSTSTLTTAATESTSTVEPESPPRRGGYHDHRQHKWYQSKSTTASAYDEDALTASPALSAISLPLGTGRQPMVRFALEPKVHIIQSFRLLQQEDQMKNNRNSNSKDIEAHTLEINTKGGQGTGDLKTDLWWNSEEMAQIRQECMDVVRRALDDAEYLEAVAKLFSSHKKSVTEDDVQASLRVVADRDHVRGLEMHICPRGGMLCEKHRRIVLTNVASATVDGLSNTGEGWLLIRKESMKASRPCRQYALKMAEHDAMEAIEAALCSWIDEEEDEEVESESEDELLSKDDDDCCIQDDDDDGNEYQLGGHHVSSPNIIGTNGNKKNSIAKARKATNTKKTKKETPGTPKIERPKLPSANVPAPALLQPLPAPPLATKDNDVHCYEKALESTMSQYPQEAGESSHE